MSGFRTVVFVLAVMCFSLTDSLFTAEAASITINAPASIAHQDRATFSVGGGTPNIRRGYCDYDVTEDNRKIVTVLCEGRSTYTLIGMSPGTATITARDKNGVTASKTVTVVIAQFRIEFPDKIKYSSGVQHEYIKLKSGTPPYNVKLSNNIIQLRNFDPKRSDILTQIVGHGQVTITATDGANRTATKSVNIENPSAGKPLNFARNILQGQTLKTNIQYSLTPEGGTPPYVFKSSNSKLQFAGSPVSGMLTFEPGTYNVTMTDKAGQSVTKQFTFTLNVQYQGLTLTLSSDTVKVDESISLSVKGGSPPYSVTKAPNLKVAPVDTSTFKLTGIMSSPSPVSIDVKDSKGAGSSKQVMVKPSETGTPKITINPKEISINEKTFLKVTGSFPPYTVTDSKGVVSVKPMGQSDFVLEGIKAGVASISVKDSKRHTVFSYVTVKEKVLPKTSKLEVTITSGDLYLQGIKGRNRILTVKGGKKPYSVTVTQNLGVQPQGETATGSSAYAIIAVKPGHGKVAVKDSAGGAMTVDVNVHNSKSK